MSTFLLLSLISAINAEMNLILFDPNTSGGQCMDGSPAGFDYGKPQHGESNLWIINVEGGGACSDKKTCDQRANSSLGSSTYWSKTKPGQNVLSDDAAVNPDFYKGHKVYARYCSGDCWVGQRTTPSSNPDTWGYYFSGHLIFENIIKYMGDHLGFWNADQVLLTGVSAGGIGTFVNADWLRSELQQNAVNKSVMLKAAPISGYFFPNNASDELDDPLMPPNDYPHWIKHENGGAGHSAGNNLYDGYVNPACAASLPQDQWWHCGSVGNAYNYIKTPIFILENKYDYAQINGVFQMPQPNKEVNNETIGYVEYFGGDMDRSILGQVVESGQTKDGLFYASCFDHGTGLSIGVPNKGTVTTIDGYNSSELVGDWFWERNKLPHIVYDKCNSPSKQLPCNPTCDGYPPK